MELNFIYVDPILYLFLGEHSTLQQCPSTGDSCCPDGPRRPTCLPHTVGYDHVLQYNHSKVTKLLFGVYSSCSIHHEAREEREELESHLWILVWAEVSHQHRHDGVQVLTDHWA